MESIVYRKPMLHSVATLKALIKNFEGYAKEHSYSGDDKVQYDEVLEAIDLIRGSITQIELAKGNVQNLVDKMKTEYDNTKNKDEKKSLQQLIESIEEDAKLTEAMKEATELTFMLSTRLTETTCKERQLARKLGIYKQELLAHDSRRVLTPRGIRENSENVNESVEARERTASSCNTIPPPRISLPQFAGNDEEFPEFWAIFNALVHSNAALSTVEKMLLLKDCLKGKSDRAIKGIQLVPENYDWMVQTLQKKYGNRPTSRARIVQRLNDLRRADNNAESSELVYDQISMLLNQMESAGQDIRPTTDAMWIETILRKFPQDIVEPVLIKTREHENTTIEGIMEMIEAEISAKSYIQSRMQPALSKKVFERQFGQTKPVPCCIFCDKAGHHSWQCRTPIPVAQKRKIVLQKRLCWKCYSPAHHSDQCSREDCPQCGRLHHIKLCFTTESTGETNANSRNVSKQNLTASVGHREQDKDRSANQTKNKSMNDSRKPYASQHKSHNTSLHIDQENPQDEIEEVADDVELNHGLSSLENHTNVVMKPKSQGEQIVLMTAEGRIWNYNTEKFERATFFFDTGAQRTIIQEEFAKRLGLPKLKTETCIMSGIGGNTEIFESNIVRLKIGTAYGKELEIMIQTKPTLTNGFPSVKLCEIDQQYLQERNILVCNPNIRGEEQVPQVLVGLDYYYKFILDRGSPPMTPSGLRLAQTVFGPALYGRGSIDVELHSTSSAMISHSLTALEGTEKELLNRLFELEGMGITAEECAEQKTFLAYYNEYSKQILFENGYITAPFPLKPNVCELSDNYASAFRRLVRLHHQLDGNRELKEWYSKILSQYEREDVIEKVVKGVSGAVGLYYMPHSGVWRPHKAKPLRIVFDASSKRKGELSLNDVTLKGESLTNKIHDILIASRTSKLIMLCDIEAAFTQIRLAESHKDLCRFLWLRDPNKPPTKDNIVEYRFKRVPFGAKPSPSILNMCILTFLRKKGTAISKEILENLYVDNILLSADTALEAIAKYRESKALFAEIGMNLREYVSNSEEVNGLIPDEDRAPSGRIKLLGVQYDTNTDRFVLKITFGTKSSLSKRDIVSQLNSIYDPIGLAAPLTVQLKHLMREIYECGIDWKDPVPSQLAQQWKETCEQIDNVSLSIPRLIGSFSLQKPNVMSLWVFADASTKALATCAYIRHEDTMDVTSLVSGKTRLTPKKCRQTIPRLETLAILMAVRLARTIAGVSKHKLANIHILSDSEIALAWLKSNRSLPQFVENQKRRIYEIKDTLESRGKQVCFWHVPSESNPADAGTRGVEAHEIHELAWINGPLWLTVEKKPRILKDMTQIQVVGPEQDEDELLSIKSEQYTSPLIATGESSTDEEVVSLPRFSKLSTAIRTFARVAKISRVWLESVHAKHSNLCKTQSGILKNFGTGAAITSDEYKTSETMLFKQAHKSISLVDLRKRFPQKKVFCDANGIIRYESRLQNAVLPYDTKNPIYVDPSSDLARLVLSDIHHKNAHCGKEHTLCIARQRFWIPQPSSAFRKFLKHCVVCKRYHGLPFGAPQMPPLPKDRVVVTKPFENIGCDFMGPYDSKNGEKLYICLYTCLSIRAIHLEVVENMSTGAFLNSFTRFISRRGVPKLIRTDCGTNFKLGQRIIETMLAPNEGKEATIMSYSASHGIQWIFNPPGAPWMGGAWERLVGTVKRAFNKSVGRKRLSFSEFYTIVTHIEAVVNTRPLTPKSLNIEEIPIRPVDFLQPSLQYALPPTDEEEMHDPSFDPQLIQTESQAKQALKAAERITAKFWDRWHKEYLTALREIQTAYRKQPRHVKLRTPQVGEIVLIEQENIPRGSWCYGKITELIKSADGLVRSVRIQMPNKHIWQRPLNKIYPLELRSSSNSALGTESDVDQTLHDQDVPIPIVRPRKAKIKAKQAIKEALEEASDTATLHANAPISRAHLSMITMVILTTLLSPSTPLPQVICSNNMVRVLPPRTRYELCIRKTCRAFEPSSEELSFSLPPTTKNGSVDISLRYIYNATVQKVQAVCELPHICDSSQTLLSRNLIANPQCWPLGALLSLTAMIYGISCACMMMTSALQKLSRTWTRGVVAHTQSAPSNVVEGSIPREGSSPNADGFRGDSYLQLQSFNPTPIGRANAATILLLSAALMSNGAGACQEGYTRHSAEMVCTSRKNCTLHFHRELLFNDVTNVVCLNILNANKIIGTISVERLEVESQCSKRTLFFTRNTRYEVFSVTRCAQVGSCASNACTKIKPYSVVAEIANASEYPGYTGCQPSCGGLLCGCLLPLPACTFYRIAHIPQDLETYEIVECMAWKPHVRLKITISLYGKTTYKVIRLRPYIPQKVNDISFTILTLSKPTSSLLANRFAIAKHETLLVPNNFDIPVECPTQEQAAKAFKNCSNKMICDCDIELTPSRCNCPRDSIERIKNDVSNVLPVVTPFIRLLVKQGEIVALSSQNELTLAIESQSLKDSAEFIAKQDCTISLGNLTGCYDCQEGATLNVSCHSDLPTWVLIQCDDYVFSVECDSISKVTLVRLEFQQAIIAKRCHAECNDKVKQFPLQGTLLFLPYMDDESVFDTHSKSWKTTPGWFQDWRLPDLRPLAVLIKEQWKAAIALFSGVVIITAATYFLGPSVVLITIKWTFQMFGVALQLMTSIVFAVYTTVHHLIQGLPLHVSPPRA